MEETELPIREEKYFSKWKAKLRNRFKRRNFLFLKMDMELANDKGSDY